MDEKGITQNQQPSNIYNIPDYPKNYTLYKAADEFTLIYMRCRVHQTHSLCHRIYQQQIKLYMMLLCLSSN